MAHIVKLFYKMGEGVKQDRILKRFLKSRVRDRVHFFKVKIGLGLLGWSCLDQLRLSLLRLA